MPFDDESGAGKAGNGVVSAVTRRVGPLPVWGWGIVAVAGVAMFVWLRRGAGGGIAQSASGQDAGNGGAGSAPPPSISGGSFPGPAITGPTPGGSVIPTPIVPPRTSPGTTLPAPDGIGIPILPLPRVEIPKVSPPAAVAPAFFGSVGLPTPGNSTGVQVAAAALADPGHLWAPPTDITWVNGVGTSPGIAGAWGSGGSPLVSPGPSSGNRVFDAGGGSFGVQNNAPGPSSSPGTSWAAPDEPSSGPGPADLTQEVQGASFNGSGWETASGEAVAGTGVWV